MRTNVPLLDCCSNTEAYVIVIVLLISVGGEKTKRVRYEASFFAVPFTMTVFVRPPNTVGPLKALPNASGLYLPPWVEAVQKARADRTVFEEKY